MRTTVNEYPRDCTMWMEAFQAKYDEVGKFGKEQWDQLLGSYSSVCDLPAIAFGPELMDAYPNAKIILTNRPVDSWHNSCSKTLLQARKYWLHGVLQHFDWITGLVHLLRRKYWQCLFDDDFESNGKAAMRAHYARIRDHAQKTGRPVLEFNLGDEWAVLCEFLEVGAPNHLYPRENEGDDWILKMRERARIRAMAAAFRFVSVGLPIAVLAFGAWSMAANFPLSGIFWV